jgi:hypothetical protein
VNLLFSLFETAALLGGLQECARRCIDPDQWITTIGCAGEAPNRFIGHLKTEHRMGRNYLYHRSGDANNAILAAVGYNFRLPIGGSVFCCAFSWNASLQPKGGN